MDEYEIRCTEQQAKKALELGAPIKLECEYYNLTGNDFKLDKPIPCKSYTNGYCYAICPTAEQMIGFLRSKGFRFHFDDVTNFWRIIFNLEIIAKGWNESKELAAIDAALDYLSNKRNNYEIYCNI